MEIESLKMSYRLGWETPEEKEARRSLLVDGKVYGRTRWCASCDRYHGKLYSCPLFTPEIKVEVIRCLKELFREIIDNPPGATVQYDNGITPPDYSFISLFLT